MTGTLLSLLSIGNMAAGVLSGILGERIGMRKTVMFLLPGYFVGYGLMSVFGAAGVLMTAFFLVGIAKGNASIPVRFLSEITQRTAPGA